MYSMYYIIVLIAQTPPLIEYLDVHLDKFILKSYEQFKTIYLQKCLAQYNYQTWSCKYKEVA